MANARVGRFNPTTPDRIARLAGNAVIQPLLMTLQISDQLVNLVCSLGICGFHPLQAPDHSRPFIPAHPCHGRLTPFVWAFGMVPILPPRDLIEMLTTTVVIQDLHRRRTQGADLCPNLGRSIGNHTQAYLLLRHQAGRCDVLEGGGQFLVHVHVRPAQDVFDPLVRDQGQPDAFGLSLRSDPAGARGPALLPSVAPALRRLRAGGHLGAINGQDQDRPPGVARRDGDDLLPARSDIQDRQPLSHFMGHRVARVRAQW